VYRGAIASRRSAAAFPRASRQQASAAGGRRTCCPARERSRPRCGHRAARRSPC